MVFYARGGQVVLRGVAKWLKQPHQKLALVSAVAAASVSDGTAQVDGAAVTWDETLFKVLQGVLAKPKLGIPKVRRAVCLSPNLDHGGWSLDGCVCAPTASQSVVSQLAERIDEASRTGAAAKSPKFATVIFTLASKHGREVWRRHTWAMHMERAPAAAFSGADASVRATPPCGYPRYPTSHRCSWKSSLGVRRSW